MQLVLREVDQKDLALALRGVAEELKEKVLRNMSQRGAEMLREDMEVSAAAAPRGRRGGPGPDRRGRPPPRGGRAPSILGGGAGDAEDELVW